MLTEGIDNGASQSRERWGGVRMSVWGWWGVEEEEAGIREQQGTATDRVTEDKNSIMLLLKLQKLL